MSTAEPASNTSNKLEPSSDFRVRVGDVTLAVSEWEGQGDPILLLHATGFHRHCWTQVIKALPGRHVISVDLRCHGQSSRTPLLTWKAMARDIAGLIEALDLYNILAVGHSIGGHLAARNGAWIPNRFKHLVLIDPVIMSPQRYAQFQTQAAALSAPEHPVSRRKNRWHSSQEMFERFADRSPFNTWQPQVLRDYCDHALRPSAEEDILELACQPSDEARIYLQQAGNEVIFEELPTLPMPVTLLRAPPGDEAPPSLNTSPTWPELAAQIPHCEEIYLPDMNHFIPMQDPALVARHILAAQ